MIAAALEDNEWFDDARLAIERLSIVKIEFTADDLRRVLRPAPVPNWTGNAFTQAKTAGIIEPVSHAISSSKTRKNGSLRVWRRRVEGDTK